MAFTGCSAFSRRTKETALRSNGIGILLLSIILIHQQPRVDARPAAINPLQDGLLVTGQQTVKSVAAEYTLVVTIAPPKFPPSLREMTQNLAHHAHRTRLLGHVNRSITDGWIRRIQKLEGFEEEVDKTRTRNFSRNRRGVLNIIGEISHTLFGTATDTSMSELRRIVQQTQVNQGRVRHQVQEMISILNQTYDNIEENRNRINDITSFIQSTITNIKELYVEQDHNKKVIRRLLVEFQMETSLWYNGRQLQCSVRLARPNRDE